MPRLRSGLDELPRLARRTVVVTTVAGLLVGAATITAAAGGLSVAGMTLIAIGITAGETVRIVLPHRRSSGVRFTFGDTAVFTGILLAGPGDVVLGMLAGVLAWQLVDRTAPIKLVFNLGQYALAGALAALTFRALTPATAAGVETVLGLTLAVLVFLAVNTVAVGTIVAATADDAVTSVLRRMLPTNALVTGCNAALALLLVLVATDNAWALPALAAPLVLVYMASRLRLAAQLDRERSEQALAIERRLGLSTDIDEIAALLVEGIDQIAGLQGAVWLRGQWRTPVPEGSGPCVADPVDHEARWAEGRAFGPAVADVPCVAVGFDLGVLVGWERDTPTAADVTPWLERFGRSAHVHLSRAETAAALEQERATLRAVVDGTADGIFVLDDAGTVALWNPAMTRLSGIGADAVTRPIDAVLGQGPWRQEGIHDVPRDADNGADPHVWRVAVAAVQDEHATGPLSVAVVHDVTEERRVSRMKDDMLAVVSHELRTPLTPIKASAQLLSRRFEQLDAGQRTRLLNEIEQRADHLARLVEDLLLVAQISSQTGGSPRVVPTAADLMEVVREEVAHTAESHPEHEVRVEGPAQLIGTTDALRLRQVVANLVDNACKYSPPGSPVLVRLAEEGEEAVLAFVDRGRGIAPEDRERIFERFERLEDPLNMTTSGAGLGLFIVRALTTALGGSTTIDGALGQGTVVTVRLPILGIPENPVWDERPIRRR